MDRKIRFRAWDKNRKVMLYPPLDIDSMISVRQGAPDGKHVDTGLGFNFPALMTWDGRCYIEGVYQDLEWSQSIGLKDAKGNEIWEGDILKHEDGNWGYGGEYDKTHDGYLYDAVPSLHEMIGDFNWDPCSMRAWEVVGNIWENPGITNEKHEEQT